MLHKIKLLWFVLFVMGLLVSCAAPAPALTQPPAPTQPPPTQPEPTQPALTPTSTPAPTATAIPHIPGNEVTIPAGEGDETIKATITGKGDIALMIANPWDDNVTSIWTPLVDTLAANENLRIINFVYRNVESTPVKDSRAVFDYLRAEGIKKIICISAGFGQNCVSLQKEPEIIGMVIFASTNLSPIQAGFPKLFVTADADPYGFAGITQSAYEHSAEPKTFKSYVAAVHGPRLFYKADVRAQVLADILDFINGIVSGR